MTSRCSFQQLHMLLIFCLLNTWTWGFHVFFLLLSFVTWEALLILSILWVSYACPCHIWIQTRFRLPPWPICWPVLTHSTASPITLRPGSLPLQREQQRGGLSAQLCGLGRGRSFLCSPSFTSQRALKKLWWELEVSFVVYIPNLSPVYVV